MFFSRPRKSRDKHERKFHNTMKNYGVVGVEFKIKHFLSSDKISLVNSADNHKIRKSWHRANSGGVGEEKNSSLYRKFNPLVQTVAGHFIDSDNSTS
jgi:hypothetical protein